MKIITVILVSFSTITASFSYSIYENLGGKESVYTERLIEFLKDWEKNRKFCNLKEPLFIQTFGVRTSVRPYYVGLKKCMLINAPISSVEKVVNGYENYQDLFLGFNKVILISKTDNLWILSWEREIPLIFVPNIKYEIVYIFSKEDNKCFKRYQLKSGGRLLYVDGIEVLEKISETKTMFYNYEFYEADYELPILGLGVVSLEKVWKDSIEGSYRSILAIRLKSENPDWSYKKIHEVIDKEMKKIDINDIEFMDAKLDFPPLQNK